MSTKAVFSPGGAAEWEESTSLRAKDLSGNGARGKTVRLIHAEMRDTNEAPR